MKPSIATAFALAAVLLQRTHGFQGATALDVQVNMRSDARGWQAPVIDKALERSPVEEQKPASFEKQHSSHAKELVKRNKIQGVPVAQATKDKNTQRQRVRVSYEFDSKKPTGSSQIQHKKRKPTKAAADSEASQNTPELQQQPNEVNKQDDGTGDLFEAESGGMVTHQYYNATQVQEQVRMVSAAVKTQMAESAALRDDSSTSIIASVAVAGFVICVVAVIVAVVALLRQYSEFVEVELESDLPTAEGGRVQPASSKVVVAMSVMPSAEGAAVECLDMSSYLPSDVEEEEETKEDDDSDDHVC